MYLPMYLMLKRLIVAFIYVHTRKYEMSLHEQDTTVINQLQDVLTWKSLSTASWLITVVSCSSSDISVYVLAWSSLPSLLVFATHVKHAHNHHKCTYKLVFVCTHTCKKVQLYTICDMPTQALTKVSFRLQSFPTPYRIELGPWH